MPSKLHHLATATLAASLSLLPIYAHADQGGIQTDGTVGGAGFIHQPQILSRPEDSNKINITENMGTRAGTNLFHSFSRFNINDGQTVTFTENTPNSLDNVIARVTGGEQSTLHGLLESTPGGHANFYLINPVGVLFGKNARINVAGDLHVSTANQLRFANGGVFDANPANRNVLSADAPTAFGFMQSTVENNSLLKDAKLTIDGAQLGIKAGKTLDLVGNKIEINNSQLSETSQLPENQTANPQAPPDAIEIRLIAQKNDADVSLIRAANGYLPLPVQKPAARTASNIAITNSTLDVSGNGGGRIGIWGNDIKITAGLDTPKSALLASNNGDIPATASGGVEIWGNSVLLTNSDVMINAESQGSTGNLKVTAEQNLMINNNAILQLSNNEKTVPITGQGGGITLESGNDLVLDSATVKLISNSSLGSGGLLIKAGDNISLQNGANITLLSYDNQASKLSLLAGKHFNLIEGGNIQSAAFGVDNNVLIFIKANGDVTLNTGGRISTDTSESGSAGAVEIIAGHNVVVDGQPGEWRHSSEISSGTTSSGNAGNIKVQASGDIALRNGARISSDTYAQGQGGNINIGADNIRLDGGEISAKAYPDSDGLIGQVELKARDDLVLDHASKISLNNDSMKDSPPIKGKSLDISATKIFLNDASTITARASGNKPATNINLAAQRLFLKDATVSTSAKGSSGGNIKITGDILLMQSSAIASDTAAKAHGGNISLNLKAIIADHLMIDDKSLRHDKSAMTGFSLVSASAPLGVSGFIRFTSPQLNLSGTIVGLGSSQFYADRLDDSDCGTYEGSRLNRVSLGAPLALGGGLLED